MAKISKKNFRIDHGSLRQHFTADINYSSDKLFYCVIPEELNIQFDHMTDAELKKLSASRLYKKGYQNDQFRRIVSGKTEDDCEVNIKLFCKSAIEKSIKKKNVIIVFYKNQGNDYEESNYNEQHQLIGLEFSLAYAIEISSGDKITYNRPYKTKFDDQERYVEINLYRKEAVIIDDTPESRAFLEKLYLNMKSLTKEMDKFMKSSNSVLQLIASNKMLLNEKN